MVVILIAVRKYSKAWFVTENMQYPHQSADIPGEIQLSLAVRSQSQIKRFAVNGVVPLSRVSSTVYLLQREYQ